MGQGTRMGAYINPGNMSKEDWLIRYARPMTEGSFKSFQDFGGAFLPVVLVDNGFFTAAAIAFNDEEIRAFTRPGESRLRSFWLAPVDLLHDVSRELSSYITASMSGEKTR